MIGTVIQASSVFGMKGLDEEHLEIESSLKKLLHLLDEANFKVDPTKIAFSDLITLLESHYINEEVWMNGFSYSGLETHKKQHQKLIQTLKEFFEEFNAVPTHSQGQEFYNLAKDLLSYHTIQADRVSVQNALQNHRSQQR